MPDELFSASQPGGEPAAVEGVVDRIVYENPDNGFFVGKLRPADSEELVSFVGNLMAVSPGETIRLQGRWVEDPKFGRQVRVESYESVMPTSVEGIEKYLGSGPIKGVGPVYAKRLVEAFGLRTLETIDKHPGRLRKVPGIGPKRAKQIREGWAEQKQVQSIMIFLQSHGISPTQAAKIHRRYGEAAVAKIRQDPYQLAEDIAGIGFAGADRVAQRLGLEVGHPSRLRAGLLHVLGEAAGNGHVFLTGPDLIKKSAVLLGAEPESVEDALSASAERASIVQEEDRCFLPKLHEAECGAAEGLKRLLSANKKEISVDVPKAVAWIEREQGLTLSGEQAEALAQAVTAPVLVITGGPGTGKTTLLRSIVRILEKKECRVALAAPTGRAAKRLEQATGRTAKTLHRTLEFSPKDGGFTRGPHNTLSADVLVVDECSMIDVQLMDALVSAVPPDGRLILVGDVDQLPSVGPGSVLMDLIASGRLPTVRLETIFRQAEASGIVRNAHRINRGALPEFNTEDFFFVERDDPAEARNTVVEIVSKRLPSKFGLDPLESIQVLSPMHRGDTGVEALNEALQGALNSRGNDLGRRGLRTGDKVIQLRNNYDLDVFNGDIGQVDSRNEDGEIEIVFEGRSVAYAPGDIDTVALAYAITIHKAQGSEYEAVVIPLTMQHRMLLQRNVIYTALTRAKRIVVMVGEMRALKSAIGNTRVTRRNTRLAERLRNV